MKLPLEGGCHCGALRYRVSKTGEAGYCHCRICQLTTGAPVLAWLHVPAGGFALIQGTPKVYKSSPRGERLFCGDCGTQLLYRGSDAPEVVDINVGSLDEPAAAPPGHHIFTASRISWFDTADDFPRYPDAAPKKVK